MHLHDIALYKFSILSISDPYCDSALQTGQLNEYTERKEMSSSVICMALGRVPAGEQRSRFLAVGLADNTIRIISLQPQVQYICYCLSAHWLVFERVKSC